MSQNLMSVGPNDKLASAADLMKLGRVRHMPVVDDDGELVGVVSQRDLFHSAVLKTLGYGTHGQEKLLAMCDIKEAMVTDVITIDSASTRLLFCLLLLFSNV
jgi:CBS-domain-containing membrane protein